MSSENGESNCLGNNNFTIMYNGTMKCPDCDRILPIRVKTPNGVVFRRCKHCKEEKEKEKDFNGKSKRLVRESKMIRIVKQNVKINHFNEIIETHTNVEYLLQEVLGMSINKAFFITRTWKKIQRCLRQKLLHENEKTKRRSNIKARYWQKLFQKYPKQMLWRLISE